MAPRRDATADRNACSSACIAASVGPTLVVAHPHSDALAGAESAAAGTAATGAAVAVGATCVAAASPNSDRSACTRRDHSVAVRWSWLVVWALR